MFWHVISYDAINYSFLEDIERLVFHAKHSIPTWNAMFCSPDEKKWN